MRAREIAVGVGAAAGLARDLRRRARLGALRARGVRPRALRPAHARPARRTACAAAATARSSRCGSRRATAPGAPTSRPRRRPRRPGVGFAVRLDKPAPFIGQEALRAERDGGRPARAAASASCSTTRARSASAPSRCASPASCAAASPRAATAAACGAASRSPTCPPGTPPPARAPRSRSSASGCRRRSWTGALYDPAGERIRA